MSNFVKDPFNPIWTGFFANHFGSLPNLAISSQMTMKLGKDIIWVEIDKLTKVFDDVIVMLIS